MINEEVKEMIECEGIGYAVLEYTNGDGFEDKVLYSLWMEARAALKKIADYLEIEEC